MYIILLFLGYIVFVLLVLCLPLLLELLSLRVRQWCAISVMSGDSLIIIHAVLVSHGQEHVLRSYSSDCITSSLHTQ